MIKVWVAHIATIKTSIAHIRFSATYYRLLTSYHFYNKNINCITMIINT